MDLTPAERKIAARLLDLAADEFSNHGCNDFNAKAEGLTPDEIQEITVKLKAEVDDDNYGANGYFDDWLLMRHLAKRLRDDT
jgi:hypothetical protein